MAVIQVLPGPLDFVVKRGDTVVGSAGFADASGNAADLSAWTWVAEIRGDLDETGGVLASFTIDTTAAASGTIGVTLAAADCAALTTVGGKATYYWDLQGTNGDTGVVRTFLGGKFKVSGDVSVAA